MANEICVHGFGMPWDGTYTMDFENSPREASTNVWVNADRTYWVARDAFKWMITSNAYHYYEAYIVATKVYVEQDPIACRVDGHYEGFNGNPSGDISLGTC